MSLHSARYNGVAAQSILDRYALSALTAQQWFTSDDPQYWAFTLQNNATDGTQLWLYDARVRSSADSYPAGTGNPSGNPNPVVGGGGGGVTFNQFALVSELPTTVNTADHIDAAPPINLVEGNLLVAMIQCGNNPTKVVEPLEPGWVLICGVNGNAGFPMLAIFARIITASEPVAYTFLLTGGVTSAINADLVQFSGNTTGNAGDGGLCQGNVSNTNDMVAPGITTTQPGDLVVGAWGCVDPGTGTITVPPGFNSLPAYAGYAFKWRMGWATFPQGPTGDQTANNTFATSWSAGLAAFRAGAPGSAPAQTLQKPIQSLQAVLPGLLQLNFGPDALALPGLVKWLPPQCFYDWAREAPIAVVQPQQSYSLAGISPEKAAWCDVTWLAIGQT